MHFRRFAFILAAFTLFTAACRLGKDDRPNWDVGVVAPLLNSSVSITDIVNDSNLVRIEGDNSITLVFRDTLINFLLSDYLEVPDTSLSYVVTLDSIRLTTDSIVNRIWLMDLARQSGFSAIGNFHNSTLPIGIPAQNGVSTPPTPIDASSLFQKAVLNNGFMDIVINNKLPADVTNATFRLKNTGLYGDTSTIILATIPYIPANAITDTSFPLAGKRIESSMEGQLIGMNVAAIPAGTAIDTNQQYVELKIKLRELSADSATAIFPEQTVINSLGNTRYLFPNGIKITKLAVTSGDLLVQAVNTVQNPIEFIYTLPTAKVLGDPVSVTTYLAEAVGGVPSIVDTVISLAGCQIDLTVNGDSTNLFPQRLIGNMKYTGNLVTMTLNDSIKIFYALKDIIPSYIEGYLGYSELDFSGGEKLDFFNSIKSGSLDLENPTLKITFANSIGVDGEVRVNEIKGYNNRTGQSVTLSAAPLSSPVFIPGPRFPNVGQTVSYKIDLDRNNSNVRNFISLLPDSLVYDLKVEANKNGIPSQLNNFATGNSKISAIMDMEVPVHGVADQLTLETELDFNPAEANLTEDVTDGALKLFVENYYPFQATAQIYFYDDSGTLLDSLFQQGQNNIIEAGVVDPDGIVLQPFKSEIFASFDNYRLTRLRTAAKKAKARFVLNSKPAGQSVKVYSTYKINFKLVGDFNYRVGN